MEEALRLRDENIVEKVTVISVGTDNVTEVLRTGLSKGADEALHIHTDVSLRQLQIAKLLYQVVRKEKFDVILFGKQSIDDECAQTGQMLAGLLECAQATQASKIEVDEQNDKFIITKEVDSGMETLEATTPVVITADLRLNTPRYASLANIMKAKRKEIRKIHANSLGIPLESRIKTISYSKVETHRSLKILDRIEDVIDIIQRNLKSH